MRVGNLPLSVVVRYVKATDSLEVARQQMLDAKISSLLVLTPEATPFAMLTSTDLLKVKTTENILVADLACGPLLTISADAEIRAACRLMNAHSCHHLVVVDNEDVVGILSSLDIVAYYLSL